MERLIQLAGDIGKLWAKYGTSYLTGMRNTLILALVATAIGCVIGFICGVLNTIPYAPGDSPVKKFFLKLIRAIVRIYVEVFRGTPRCCRPCSCTMACPTLQTALPGLTTSGWPPFWWSASTPALTWPNPSGAALSP